MSVQIVPWGFLCQGPGKKNPQNCRVDQIKGALAEANSMAPRKSVVEILITYLYLLSSYAINLRMLYKE